MPELGPNSFIAQPDTTKLPPENQRGAGRDATMAVASEPLDNCDGADPITVDTHNQTDSQSPFVMDISGHFELDSFLPIAKALPSILRHGGLGGIARWGPYYFEGAPAPEDAEKLRAFVTKIEGFTLNKAALKGISFSMLLHLSGMRNWPGPFFPALKTLRILDCDNATLQVLSLFLSPSLETVEVTVGHQWDDGSYETLDSFLATISALAPRLACFKHTPLDSTSWALYEPLKPDCSPFQHVRSLHLERVAVWEWQSMQALGELDSLDNLTLITVSTFSYRGRAPRSTDGAQWDILMDCAPYDSPASFGCKKLKILNVSGHVEFLRDFLGYIGSNELQKLSIELLSTSGEPASPEELKEELLAQTHNSAERFLMFQEDTTSLIRASGITFTFQNEDEFFCHLIDKATEKWTQLKAIAIQATEVPREHFMSAETIRRALALASLEHLEISEWVIDHDLGNIIDEVYTPSKSSLKIFHLPTTASMNRSTRGIPWVTLSKLAKAFPHLVSFRGYLQREISRVPDYTFVPRPQPNFNTNILTLGDGPISWDNDGNPNYLLRVGLYIFSLFPNVKEIHAAEEADDKVGAAHNWEQIKQLVRMCQTSTRIVGHPGQ
ncbi:hypothetical protein D9619_010100 [Psilocybe cf. subviscida]|uniref:Uncharacterized protein n=1 Tax=Psilocybe cf. subviscida TaxID=2480587 RepID=A0A8H5F6R1_9AGAR|nr:hypothetical protein D9619_010100 [Psilocybe cf. subviscida]